MNNNCRQKVIIFDANFKWTEQIFRAFTDIYDVLLLKPKDFRSYKKIYGSYKTDLNAIFVKNGLWHQRICMPPGWLFIFWKFILFFFKYIIKKFVSSSNIKPIIVITYPHYLRIWELLDCYKIYYCLDYYDDYWPGKEKLTQKKELESIIKSDLTICLSKTRCDFFKNIVPNKNIIHIPLGSPENILLKNFNSSIPKNIIGIKHPIAGYIGGLNYRFDFAQLFFVASKLPEISFIIGGIIPNISNGDTNWYNYFLLCKSSTNIHFLDYVNNEDIASYVSHIDILILPYSKCEFNIYACPMKLWEYLATGKPIVSNENVPEILLYKDVVLVAKDNTEFVKKIQEGLLDPYRNYTEKIEIAKSNTWHAQSRKIIHHLNTNLNL